MTENDVNERNLTQQESLAIQLKYEGRPNSEIAETLGNSVNTIEHWFGSRGRLSKEYNDYSKELTESAKKEAVLTLKRNIGKAAQVVVDLLDFDNPNLRLRSATYMIDRELGRPAPKKEDLENDNSTIEMLVASLDLKPEKIDN